MRLRRDHGPNATHLTPITPTAVLWRGGISFGGVVSFIFADLIVLPILDIYRRYYGGRAMLLTMNVPERAMDMHGDHAGHAMHGL